MAAVKSSRGAELLLVHCAELPEERPPAYVRLQDALGRELARFLVSALARRQGRRASSSP
jgi:hypothetical protein